MGFTDLQDGHGLIGISDIPTDCFFLVLQIRGASSGPHIWDLVTKCGSEPVLETTKFPH